jgi:hypothetical protein
MPFSVEKQVAAEVLLEGILSPMGVHILTITQVCSISRPTERAGGRHVVHCCSSCEALVGTSNLSLFW